MSQTSAIKNDMLTHQKNDRSNPARPSLGFSRGLPYFTHHRRTGYGTAGWKTSLPFKGLGVAAVLFVVTFHGAAQQALHDSMANDAAQVSRSKQMQSPDYTYKNGDFQTLLTPSLDLQWNDNINLTQDNVESDFIVEPAMGVTVSYPLTQENLLYLDVSIGYRKYISHSEFDTLDLNSASGSGFSFDIGIKDVKINVHDRFNYTQDSAQNPQVANTGSYGTFQNAAGLSALWDLNDVTVSGGYDHQTVFATSGQFSQDNQSSELLNSQIGFKVHPRITTGLEATASFTSYDQSQLNNNSSYSFGVYADIRPDTAFRIEPRIGYTLYDFSQTSTNIHTSNLNSWYADLNVNHDITKNISYSVDGGREVALGIQSDVTVDWYVRPKITWNIIKNWRFDTGFFYEQGTEGGGSTGLGPGNLGSSEKFEWYGGNFSVSHALTKRFDLSLSYRLTMQSSSTVKSYSIPGVFYASGATDSRYTQNLVELKLTYHPPRLP